jgi:RNA polymerase sigma factor (sigma-70 family)
MRKVCVRMGAPAPALQALLPEQLLRRVAEQQDRAAFTRLFQQYAPRLKSWLMGRGIPEALAEDILQDTWISVWQKAGRFDPARASFATWLYTIARHRQIDRLRQRGLDPLPDFEDENLFDATQKDIAEEQELVDKALKALPPEQYELVYEMFYHGKTHLEIATEQRLPLGTVKSRMRLAMDKLHKIAEYLSVWLIFTLMLRS